MSRQPVPDIVFLHDDEPFGSVSLDVAITTYARHGRSGRPTIDGREPEPHREIDEIQLALVSDGGTEYHYRIYVGDPQNDPYLRIEGSSYPHDYGDKGISLP